MKYTVTLGASEHTVDLTGDRVVIDGRVVAAELHAVPGTPLRRLVLPDASLTFIMTRDDGGWRIGHHGEELAAAVLDERTRLLREMTVQQASATAEQVIRAPMPGLVLRVEIAAGDAVAAGGLLLVLEAMKMENDIRAQGAGVVRAVHVAPGQALERGAPLVEIAPPEA